MRFILHSITPLILGILIYCLFREISLFDPFQSLFPMFPQIEIPHWILYQLPDALWFYALLSSLLIIWKSDEQRHIFLWLAIATLLSFSMEFSQKLGLVPGTFDWYDLLAFLLAGIPSIAAYHLLENTKNINPKASISS